MSHDLLTIRLFLYLQKIIIISIIRYGFGDDDDYKQELLLLLRQKHRLLACVSLFPLFSFSFYVCPWWLLI